MSYSVWSVVFGEVPTTSKWNILGTNDASFNDGSGLGTGVSLSDNPYSVGAYSTTDNIAVGNNTITLPLNAEYYDTNGDFDTTNYEYTAPVSGKYMFCLLLFHWGMSTGRYINARLMNNGGSAGYFLQEYMSPTHASATQAKSGTLVVDVDANDVLSVSVTSAYANVEARGGEKYTGLWIHYLNKPS